MKVVSGGQMREIERIAIDELGIPSIILMENAALRLAERCLEILKNKVNPKVIIVCGPGNNGGDGLALARHLHNSSSLEGAGVETSVFYAGDFNAVKGDPAVYLEIIKKLGLLAPGTELGAMFGSADIVVDALLGTGLSRNVDQNYAAIIEMINKCAKYVISADIPSGVHADTGQIMGCAVEADETVTFAYPKTGIMVYPGAGYAGKVHIGDISLPANSAHKAEVKAQALTDSEAKNLLPVRKKRSNKGSYGKIMIFAGSSEMPGAAALASSAAYMTGGGLVCACVLKSVASVIHRWQREVVTRIVPEENGLYCKKSVEAAAEKINQASVIVIGPGIGRAPCVTEFVIELINKAQVPLVLDADALFAAAEYARALHGSALNESVNILKNLKPPCIITPHAGEMSRLVSIGKRTELAFDEKSAIADILNNTIDTAVSFSRENNVVTLLKDARTIIAHPDGDYFINTTGNDALSKAGTGDVLTGMISGFIAQGLSPFTAGALGAYLHGKAGEMAALKKSHYGAAAGDLIKNIPLIINEL